MRVVSFTDLEPTPRFDSVPWTQVTVEESDKSDGPWTLLATINLIPVDADPSEPASRSVTVANATLDSGWYQITFLDDAGNSVVVTPIYDAPAITWRPTLSDVGNIAIGRTADANGNILGTFTENTQPTAEQAQRAIENAVRDLAPDLGEVIPADLVEDAKALAALRAAMYIELSNFGSEIPRQLSPYPQYKVLFDENLPRVRRAIEAEEAGGDPADAVDVKWPAFDFPDPDWVMSRRM